jgi:hypothetical protein
VNYASCADFLVRLSSETVRELRGLERERIEEFYVRAARASNHTVAGFYLDELQRRDARRRERFMVALTVIIATLTVIIAILTAASLWAVLRASDTRTDDHHHHHHARTLGDPLE